MTPQRRLSSGSRASIIRKNIRKVDAFEDGDRDNAVAAAQKAAQNAVQTVFVEPSRNTMVFGSDLIELHSTYSPVNNNNHNSTDDGSYEESQSSLLSRERALFRGSARGFFEENENSGLINTGGGGSLDDGFSLDRGDLTTIEETGRSTGGSSKTKKMSKKKRGERLSRFIQSRTLKLIPDNSAPSPEVWMCGVCSKSFSSFSAAKKHEDYHIKEIVMDLGWLCDTPDLNIDTDAPNNNNSAREFNEGIQHTSLSAPRALPPIPKPVSFTGADDNNRPQPPPSMRFEPLNDFEEFLNFNDSALPNVVGGNNLTVLADEALVDVCSKAEKLILTQVEKEAEFELEMCSRDRKYYNTLELRDIKRQQEGAYSRFKTDGKNFAQKVQNKMVDAYAIMKEGKDKKSHLVVDHYTRKYKGDSTVQTEIDNTRKTLYINVIVKNSVKVVTYELERLAKQRWEEYKAEHTEVKTDNRSDENRAQFEKFKAAAQGSLVKFAGYALSSDFTPRRIAVQLSNDLYR